MFVSAWVCGTRSWVRFPISSVIFLIKKNEGVDEVIGKARRPVSYPHLAILNWLTLFETFLKNLLFFLVKN